MLIKRRLLLEKVAAMADVVSDLREVRDKMNAENEFLASVSSELKKHFQEDVSKINKKIAAAKHRGRKLRDYLNFINKS